MHDETIVAAQLEPLDVDNRRGAIFVTITIVAHRALPATFGDRVVVVLTATITHASIEEDNEPRLIREAAVCIVVWLTHLVARSTPNLVESSRDSSSSLFLVGMHDRRLVSPRAAAFRPIRVATCESWHCESWHCESRAQLAKAETQIWAAVGSRTRRRLSPMPPLVVAARRRLPSAASRRRAPPRVCRKALRPLDGAASHLAVVGTMMKRRAADARRLSSDSRAVGQLIFLACRRSALIRNLGGEC